MFLDRVDPEFLRFWDRYQVRTFPRSRSAPKEGMHQPRQPQKILVGEVFTSILVPRMVPSR
jgi:hypothetical protein